MNRASVIPGYTDGMWPFDLRGPEFLVLYLVVGGGIMLALYLLRHMGEPESSLQINLSDPYLVAYLRGGKNETLRVVTMSLIDRAILKPEGTRIAIVDGALKNAGPGLEQKVAQFFTPSADAVSVFKLDGGAAVSRYQEQLMQAGLLPDDDAKQAQLVRMAVALVALLALGITKLVVAIETGHKNVAFLIVLMIVFTIATVVISRPRLTRAGQETLVNLRSMFDGLKGRREQIRNGVSPGEFAMMAAVFGTAAIPGAKALFPRAGGSSCGSGCGSDSGSSSSCGGGSGCGGCGGG
ncbi:MAG TPA: TIGR04222 domain-containing membrane protein [Bryobacteraceae bacterium]|nr:TIGR04222 domain-containing membrane protein [Bryobacteraceae bacterium]